MTDGKTADKKGPPWDDRVGDRITGRYGFKDGRVEIEVLLPPPFNMVKKTVSLAVHVSDLKDLKRAVDKAAMWADLPDFQRERDGAP